MEAFLEQPFGRYATKINAAPIAFKKSVHGENGRPVKMDIDKPFREVRGEFGWCARQDHGIVAGADAIDSPFPMRIDSRRARTIQGKRGIRVDAGINKSNRITLVHSTEGAIEFDRVFTRTDDKESSFGFGQPGNLAEEQTPGEERGRREDYESERDKKTARLELRTESAQEINRGERQAERRHDASQISAGEFQR